MSTPGEQAQQASTVRLPKRFPLATQPGFRSTTLALADPTVLSPVSDACLINAYAELDPEDGQYWVEKRPGVKILAQEGIAAPGGTGVGYDPTFNPTFKPVFINYTNLFSYSSSGVSNIPYTGTNALPIVIGRVTNFLQIPVPNVNPLLVWCVNGSMWFANLFSASPGYVNVIDLAVTVPWTSPLCDGCAYLDGVLYVMDQTGSIWGSDLNNIGSWTATTLIQAGGRNDLPVCLVQQLEYVIALKSTSLRCFYDSGAAAQTLGVGSNLAWVEGADANYGCANAGSVQLIDQSLLWVTNNDKNTPQIARMDGLQVTIVSTPQVERLLQHIKIGAMSASPSALTNVLYSGGIKRGGHRWYVLTVPPSASSAGPFSLIYDLDQQLWYIWTTPGFAYWTVTGISAHADSDTGPGGSVPGVFCQDINSGAFYVLDIDQVYPVDILSSGATGIPAQVDIYTPSSDLGTKRRKQLNAMYFQNDQVSGSAMQVRKSDNDMRSWGPFRLVSLSTDRPNMTRCGTFTKRALNIRHSAPTPFRIKAGDLQLDLGTL